MTDFATHRRLLDTDNAYRAKLGLGPLSRLETASAAITNVSNGFPTADPLITATEQLIETAQAALTDAATAPVGDASAGIDGALFVRIDRLSELRKELKRLSDAIGAEIEAGQEQLVEMYTHAGTGLIEIGGRVGTLGSQIWARKVDESVTSEDVAAALRADGLGHLVSPESYNSSRLSAFLRDLDEENKPIPPHLAQVIEANERWRVGFTTRRATRAQRRMNGAASSVVDGASDN